MWDDRDKELNLRDRMASLIAIIVSGVEPAEPEPSDYALADTFRVFIEENMK